ncbi:MAG TPA: hypothetical protein VMW52_12530 [Phycisphaerae bacterium]|nr:hypothetical protein [Phycisphaerae bacterium]
METSYGIGSFPGPLDANLQLMDEATKEGTGASDVVDLGENFAPSPAQPLAVEMNVTALDTVTGNETYSVKLQESYDNSNWSDTGLQLSVTATGLIHKVVGVSRRYLRLYLTLAGTTPSITADAWVNRT